MEPWNETTLGAVKGKVKFIQKYGTGVDSVDLKAAGKKRNSCGKYSGS